MINLTTINIPILLKQLKAGQNIKYLIHLQIYFGELSQELLSNYLKNY